MNVVRISDGLGNQMFQYAFARKISILTRYRVYLDTRFINNEDLFKNRKNDYYNKKMAHREYGLDCFHIKLPLADDKVIFPWKYIQKKNYAQKAIYWFAAQNMWPWRYKREYFNFEGGLSGCDMMFPTYYYGYFFNLEYYDDIKKILQKELSLKDKIKLPSDIIELLRDENTVSLHVRRGDFLRLNRDMSNSEYYQKAVRIIESKISDPVYLIFSDDIGWVMKNMQISGRKIYVSEMGFKDYEEWTIMKHCRHNIIANSTFSYWAAYLNSNENKIVICPKHWRKDIIPTSWIES